MGAAINGSSRVFSWTPTEAQGPGVYTFKVKVTDDGTPAMSDEETIMVTVNEVNVAPALASIGSKSVTLAIRWRLPQAGPTRTFPQTR